MRKMLIATVVSLLAAGAAHAAGEVYGWKDASGNWHYSDQPMPGAKLLKGSQQKIPTPALPNMPPPAPAAIPTDPAGAPVVSAEVAQQVRA
ncbi:MAG: DUF4124 domain-containing protein, partial [Steroidobacteraceae bacterium]